MNQNKNNFFNYMIEGMDSKMQAQLNYMFTHLLLQDEYKRKMEREQLKKEIIAEILPQLRIEILNLPQVKEQIKELREEIEKFGDMGGAVCRK